MTIFIVIGIVLLLIWIFSGKDQIFKPLAEKGTDEINLKQKALQHFEIAEQKIKQSDITNAIKHYTIAINYEPLASYYRGRAAARWKANDYKGTIEDLDVAVKIEPELATNWAYRSIAHYEEGNFDLAVSDSIFAINLGYKFKQEWVDKFYRILQNEELIEEEKIQKAIADSAQEAELVKQNKDQIEADLLSNYNIEYLYHITHKKNLKNIFLYGLLSNTDAHKGLNKENIADEEVNIRRESNEPIFNRKIHDYVPLYFNPKNPMLFKRRSIHRELVILAIDKRILKQKDVLFTDGNAASHVTQFYNTLEDLSKLNWDCIECNNWNDYPDGKRIRCAEVLVFPKIPADYIQKIYCDNTTLKEYAIDQIEHLTNATIEVNTNLYFFR